MRTINNILIIIAILMVIILRKYFSVEFVVGIELIMIVLLIFNNEADSDHKIPKS